MDLSEWNEYLLKKKFESFKITYDKLIKRIDDIEKRINLLESENRALKKILRDFELPSDEEEIWLKIRGLAIESKTLSLLNPSKKFNFQIVEVSKDYIRVDKLGRNKLSKEMFLSVYKHLKERGGWVKIGASVVDTNPDTVEGFIKTNFFNGNLDALMTAPWISALLVKADVGIEFNNKAIGQAIRYLEG